MIADNNHEKHKLGFTTLYTVSTAETYQPLFFDEPIVSVTGGRAHIVFCTESGSVYAHGSNQQGQCGFDASLSNLETPRQIVDIPACKQVACGYEYSMFLTHSGEIYGTGETQYGQLGLGIKTHMVTLPQKCTFFLEKNLDVETIACGFYHSLFLTRRGVLYACGHGHNGQLGVDISSEAEKSLPTLISKLEGHRVVQLAPGGYHTLVLTSENRIFAFGNNAMGQLGLGHRKTELYPVEVSFDMTVCGVPRRILCGGEFSSIVTADGSMYSCGSSGDGQLGAPVSSYEEFKKISLPGNVQDVSHGKYQNVLLTTDNKVYVTGVTFTGTKFRAFKELSEVGLQSSTVNDVYKMLANTSVNRTMRVFTAYRDIIFALSPCNGRLSHFFNKLLGCTKFKDLEIVTMH